LEIGVASGYSLRMWREFFTTSATLHFADTAISTKKHEVPGTKVWIGDGTRPELLRSIAAEAGGRFDLIVDDGSHAPQDVRATFMHAFPLLRPGGILVIEDLNSAYLPRGAGSATGGMHAHRRSRHPNSHVEMLKSFIDTLNRHNFDANYTAGVEGIDHEIGSLFCTEEACAVRRRFQRRAGSSSSWEEQQAAYRHRRQGARKGAPGVQAA
jgi:hypothetical protein